MCVSNVLIVEKDFDASFLITKKLKDLDPELNVFSGGTSLDAIKDLLFKRQPELVIINLDTKEGFGFELLENLYRKKFEILFTSTSPELAFDAIKFAPVDFLLKPLELNSLKNALQKTNFLIQQKSDAKTYKTQQTYKDSNNILKVANSAGHRYININDIIRLEADGVYTKIYLNDGRKIISSSNLGKYEKLLLQKAQWNLIKFHRIHYKHLINLNHVTSFSNKVGGIALTDGTELNVAQRRLKAFKNIWKVA